MYQVYSMDEFFRRTMGGRPCQLDMSLYTGLPFDCACGESHQCVSETVPVIRELTGMRLVLGCPNDGFLTCVRIKGLFRYRFETLFGGFIDERDCEYTPKNVAEILLSTTTER